jgi:hypothetical protein
MAQKVVTVVTLTDDLDGGKADQTVTFAWDGVNYEIDLSKKNAAAFQRALKPYVDSARRVQRRSTRGSRRAAGTSRSARRGRADLEAIRTWARGNGFSVADRGRIPAAVLEAYNAAN